MVDLGTAWALIKDWEPPNQSQRNVQSTSSNTKQGIRPDEKKDTQPPHKVGPSVTITIPEQAHPAYVAEVFYCYARKDKALRDELQVSLAGLRHQYQLTNWHDGEILPGKKWEEAIDTHLSIADVILLLISPHFVNSDYCYGKEMQRALEQHHANNCCVVPILLRPTYWEATPLATIQMLPTDARPVTSKVWPDRYEAFHDVAKGISTAIKAMLTSRAQMIKDEGNALRILKQYEEALTASNEAIRHDPSYTLAYAKKSYALNSLKRYEEALAASNEAIRHDPKFAPAYANKSYALNSLKRYEEALAASNEATCLNPRYVIAHSNKSYALNSLKRYEEALAASNEAIRHDPEFALAYANKGYALDALGRGKEAQEAIYTARQLGYSG